MEGATVNGPEGPDCKEREKRLIYHSLYNDPLADVVLMSTDGIGFRIHDYYLKAASPVFRDMLSLPTRVGPIQLPETSEAIRVVLDETTNIITTGTRPSFHVMTEALQLAKRLDMKGPTVQIQERFRHYQNDVMRLFAWACQQDPVDRFLARTALSAFSNPYMKPDPEVFRPEVRSTTPFPKNLTPMYIESLTTVGYAAYSRAIDDCQEEFDGSLKWQKVPNAFIRHLDRLER
ncbi:hypothetical protein QFC21_001572 [Naganishia friedmannii]|uniref:Uncharacterized protein n=1 Tax=Naganishia friedmannii TaxID=89922 RepID=A0ACC2W5S9_9TREE|nr:hypothetical protein QFC21_001572 [Naganishia friedmannii]